jgi:WD40 repeat protein
VGGDCGTRSYLLAVVSSDGHVCIWSIPESGEPGGASRMTVNLHRFLLSTNFQNVAFSKDGSLLIIVSGAEILLVENKEGKWRQSTSAIEHLAREMIREDFIIDVAVHPTNCAVALCSSLRKSVLIVGVPGVRVETQSLLSKLPVSEDSSESLKDSWHSPHILNELSTNGRNHPISVCWSPYGEMLAFATSDNYISLWNVATGTIETMGLEEGLIIREIVFLSDSHLLVASSDINKLICLEWQEVQNKILSSVY